MKEQLFRKVMCENRNPSYSGKYDTDKGKESYNKDRNIWDAEKYFGPNWWLEPVENTWHNPDEIPTERDQRFPSYSVDILVTDGIRVWTSFYNHKKHCFGLNDRTIVIAWMPFPEPFKPEQV